MSDAQLLHDGMTAAGFDDVEVIRDELTVVFDDADHLIRTLGAAPVGAKVRALDTDAQGRLRAALVNAAAALTDGRRIRGTMTCHATTGAA